MPTRKNFWWSWNCHLCSSMHSSNLSWDLSSFLCICVCVHVWVYLSVCRCIFMCMKICLVWIARLLGSPISLHPECWDCREANMPARPLFRCWGLNSGPGTLCQQTLYLLSHLPAPSCDFIYLNNSSTRLQSEPSSHVTSWSCVRSWQEEGDMLRTDMHAFPFIIRLLEQ